MSEAFNLPLKILLTYFVLYYLLPNYFQRRKYKMFFLLFFLAIGCGGIIFRITQGFIILPWFYPERAFTPWDLGRFLWPLFEVFSITAIAVSIKIFKLKYESDKHEDELQKEKLRAELSFLKAQINPHFLFNTLNNIYGLSLKNSPQTSEAILKLSGLLHFIVYDGASETIGIEEEIKILEDYIELEKLRYGQRVNITFNKKIDNKAQQLSPLLFLPFIENSFKHGAGETRVESFIRIDLSLQADQLLFSVSNGKDETNHTKEGIGLKNIKRQLELAYGKFHHLEIHNREDNFKVHLKIDLKGHAEAQLLNH